jgi:hypothetical protein
MPISLGVPLGDREDHAAAMLNGIAAIPGAAAWPQSWERLSESLDIEWVRSALEATGKASVRRRRLPAEQVVWLVIGMGLLRDRSIASVVDHLGLALSDREGQPVVAPSAISQARARLGVEPMQQLFRETARRWAHESASRDRWRGLALYGVDGTRLFAADTPSNDEAFGRHVSGKGESAYPMVRLVALLALRSRLLAGATFGSYSGMSEVATARPLWSELPDNSLVIVDRGFFTAPVLAPIPTTGSQRHWLTRANKNTRWEVVEQLAEGDAIVEMTTDKGTRSAYPELPERWRMRAVAYQRPGHAPQTLLTSMLDPTAYPAAELAALYHERWEIELAFDDLKTEQLHAEHVLRSQLADGVRQEMWGILLAHNLVRLEIQRIADRANVPSRRVSFIAALRLICEEWHWATLPSAKAGALPKALARLEEKIKRFILPERRSLRLYPRALKIAKPKYPSKAAVLRRTAAAPN